MQHTRQQAACKTEGPQGQAGENKKQEDMRW
jgi:hypothetical protein